MIIIPLWIKTIQFHFIPPKYENHNHGMIFKSMKFILKRDDYYTFIFAVQAYMPVALYLLLAIAHNYYYRMKDCCYYYNII